MNPSQQESTTPQPNVEDLPGNNPEQPATPESAGQPEQPRRHLWRWVVGILCGLVLLLVVGFFALPHILNLVTSDIPPIDDSDLVFAPHSILDEQNGYTALVLFDATAREVDIDRVALEKALSGDMESARALVETHAELLSMLDDFLSYPIYQDPILAHPDTFTHDVKITMPSSLRQVSLLSVLDGAVDSLRGSSSEAVAAFMRPLQVAQHIGEPNASLIGVLGANTMYDLVFTELMLLKERGVLDATTTRSLRAALTRIDIESTEGLVSAIQSEYVAKKNSLGKLDESKPYVPQVMLAVCRDMSIEGSDCEKQVYGELGVSFRSNYYYRPNETLALYAKLFRSQMRAARQACDVREPVEVPTVVAREKGWRLYFEENALGKVLFEMSAAGLDGMFERRCETIEKYNSLLEALSE